jgi:flagellar hook-basal body complex protein FliE
MQLNGITTGLPLPPPTFASTVAGGAAPQGASFKDLLLDSLREVNGMQQDAQHAVEQLVTGGEANMAEVMTTVQKADMSFRLMLQMRNKLVQASEEIKDVRI